MKAAVFIDYAGRQVRLTPERRKHILEHPEMREWVEKIAEVLGQPERVVRSRFDPESELFYVWKTRTRVGPRYLCVVVVVKPHDAFVLTACLTDAVFHLVPSVAIPGGRRNTETTGLEVT